ncbi:Sec-independent protein translocase protein TatB [Crenobacter cavernae]|uniref:Sec-independent protein translocase protein TatB n=1 Tax=Crenobacter cavernae TaxID=2290923 RepID=A0ABY0FD15_9NEIS|nr:twin-arginine translocase subunit TatB [Crenobacter cavernae]
MFEISFGELLLIGVVALVVLGPEKLPAVARTVGALVGRLQRFVSSVKSDIHRETEAAGLIGLKTELQDAATVFQQRIESEVNEIRQAGVEAEREIADASAEVKSLADVAMQPDTRSSYETGIATEPNLAVAEAEAEAAQVLFAAAPDAPAPHAGLDRPDVDENQLDLFTANDKPAETPRA